MATQDEFKEIAHSGGQLTIKVVKDQQGNPLYQLGWHHCRPGAAGMFAIYALPPHAIPVCQVRLGGIGSPMPGSPIPGCYLVFIGSDSEGLYGRECANCGGYWRNKLGAVCPYCGIHDEVHNQLTLAQKKYVKQYCDRMMEIIEKGVEGDYVIDMDAVADAAGNDAEKPPFYYAEQSQQHKFTCEACGELTDILGTYGYCSSCGTRNDLRELTQKIAPTIRNRINAGGPYESCVRDTVAAFDSFVGQYIQQLITFVRMTSGRRERLSRMRFHNLQATAEALKQIFDIDILQTLSDDDREFVTLMFHRRHVYEHLGGEADEKYIAESGDKTVRPKQALRESQESAHRTMGIILKMARDLHEGFHEIVPVLEGPIKRYHPTRP